MNKIKQNRSTHVAGLTSNWGVLSVAYKKKKKESGVCKPKW